MSDVAGIKELEALESYDVNARCSEESSRIEALLRNRQELVNAAIYALTVLDDVAKVSGLTHSHSEGAADEVRTALEKAKELDND